jgi:hypothetical protein
MRSPSRPNPAAAAENGVAAPESATPISWRVTRLQCRNCGSPLDPRRVELGYDYCLNEDCQQRYVKRVRLAALGVNKAADYYVRAEEVLPPPAPAPVPPGTEEEEGDDPGGDGDEASAGSKVAAPTRDHPSAKRPQSTLERLRQREAALDQALGQSYEQFRRNEITAREMEAEQRRLVAEFNQLVMGENIRYRSLLRRKPS